jgi:glycosyltransferase involved in cell wall biosynthesis
MALNWVRRHERTAVLMSETKRDDERRWLWKEMAKSVMYTRHFDSALVGGQSHAEYLHELGFARNRIFFGYDVVDNEYFALGAASARAAPVEHRRRDSRLPRRPYFVAVTRFLPRKNLVALVRAYGRYRENRSERAWDLVICGTGPEETTIANAIREAGLSDAVHQPGFVSYQDLPAWYGLAEALVHPAIREPWGLVINEACAAGLPVLSSRTVGAALELVHEHVNGLLFDPHDEAMLANALLHIHDLGADRRLEMGRQGQRIVARFGPAQFADGLVAAAEIASERRQSRYFGAARPAPRAGP